MGTPDPLPALSNDVDRDANCVIAMQRYLTLFSRVESAFESRLKSVAKIDDAAAREQAVRTQVFDPLAGLATLLEREPMRQPEDRLFKLGELRLLVGALSKASAATERSRFEPLIVRLDDAMKVVSGQDQMRSDYRNFVSQISVKAI